MVPMNSIAIIDMEANKSNDIDASTNANAAVGGADISMKVNESYSAVMPMNANDTAAADNIPT